MVQNEIFMQLLTNVGYTYLVLFKCHCVEPILTCFFFTFCEHAQEVNRKSVYE